MMVLEGRGWTKGVACALVDRTYSIGVELRQ